MNDEELMRAAARLAREIRPERDLWAGIEEAINEPVASRWRPMLAQAAAVLLLIGATSTITYMAVKDTSPRAVVTTPDMIFERASFGNRYTLGPGFQDARNGLVAELNIEFDRLSPEAEEDIRTNLTMIHTAINNMNDELEKDPGNTLLQEQLLRMYHEELALLRRVSGLSRNVMMRNDI
ncbi:MAG TPA: hypothetical protein PKH39_00765 [Woeseiaceae bacterium]|nr:hypothetical protein [Woeseiaceae bacterium]